MFEYNPNEHIKLKKKLAGAGLGEKLDLLKDKLTFELDYEYFRFRFRVLRNRVAHGRLTNAEVETLAGILLIDLHVVCECIRSSSIPVNRRVSLAGVLKKELDGGKVDRSFIVQYFLLNHIQIPLFYNLDDLEELLKPIFTDDFLGKFEEKWNLYPEENQAAFKEFLLRIKKRYPSLKSKTTELYKKLECKNIDARFTQRDTLDFEMRL